MHRIAAALLIFMSGCGGNSEDGTAGPSASLDNHGYGFAFDAMGKEGLKLRQPGATARDADFFEARAIGIEACSGIEAPPPPFVIVVPRDSLGDKRIGLYFSSPPLILIDEGWVDVAFGHETLHYLLDRSTGSPDPTHQNPVFPKCVISFPD